MPESFTCDMLLSQGMAQMRWPAGRLRAAKLRVRFDEQMFKPENDTRRAVQGTLEEKTHCSVDLLARVYECSLTHFASATWPAPNNS